MKGRIPQSFIDDLVSRVDIADVISERVPLKKAGHEFKACCPFHDEKTPSFTVSPSKQFYHCFGCGVHGTVLGFLMDYERLEFIDAVEVLAGRLGLEIPRDGSGTETVAPSRNEAIYAVLEAAQSFYLEQLRAPASAAAIEYLKGRGLSGEIARDFGLGFAPSGWDNLVKRLRAAHGEDLLVDAGLAIRSDRGSVYDRFRDRVMFPIRDSRGRVIAFGGRVIDPQGTPKYLNSSDSAVFHKGRELYGLWEARRSVRKLDRLLVVEGYMDVVALAQHGIRYAVATLGTAATADHIERLFRTTSAVVFAFDGDDAGRRAASRALETVLPAMRDGREVSFLFLPEGEDPDSRVRAVGRAGFESDVASATSALEFLFAELQHELRGSPEAYARLIERASAQLRSIPGEALVEVARKRLSTITGISMDQLHQYTGGASARQPLERSPTTASGAAVEGEKAQHSPHVRRALRVLLNFPAVAAEAPGRWWRLVGLEKPGVGLLVAVLDLLRERPDLKTASLIEHFREHAEGRHLGRLAAAGPPPGDESRMAEELRDALAGLYKELDEQRFALLTAKSRVGTLTEEERGEFLELVANSPGALKPAGR